MSYAAMMNEIERVFAVPARKLEIMRIDLAADVSGITVAWFRDRLRIAYKQFQCEIGLEYAAMGKREIQTLYYGRRPNCYRVYDKIAERRGEYARLIRNVSTDAEIPSFDEVYGCPDSSIVTRVERQIGAGRVPPMLASVRALPSASEFNPFERIQILSGGKADPKPEDYRLTDYLTGRGLRQMISEKGMQGTRSFINKHSKENASRLLQRYSEFIPADDPSQLALTAARLFEIYRECVGRQLAA